MRDGPVPRAGRRRRSAGGGALTVDGRTRRSQRSRGAIETALFDLVGEGVLRPTAQQVADRAQVGIRSVFRHFSDMESLYATLEARLAEEVAPMLSEAPPSGTLATRASALVRQRAALFERIAPYKRSSNLQRARSPFLERQHRKFVTQLREDLLRWLPELAEAPAEVLEALDQVASFEAWDRLRTDQRLGRARAVAVIGQAVQALVGSLATR